MTTTLINQIASKASRRPGWIALLGLIGIGVFVFASVCDIASPLLSIDTERTTSSNYLERPAYRRGLSSPDVNPVLRNHVKPVRETPDPAQETVLFWHIPKSGGTTLKSVYKCMKQTLAIRAGVEPRFGHDKDTELVAFEAGGTGSIFVNVDTLSRRGILRAKRLGLVPSGLADMIVTVNLNFALEHLYDEAHRGRVLALFRHPVDRLVSKFYYNQVATWERSYKPGWKDMDIAYWAENVNVDRNIMVKMLAGLSEDDDVKEEDLRTAIRTVKQRFVVGLMNQMEESVHRFNIFMGIDESEENNKQCMDEFFGHGVKKSNANAHPKVEETSLAWQTLAQQNAFDIRLYEEIVEIFDKQREIIRSHALSLQ